MFRHLTDYGFQRTPLQAIGFYLTYFVLGVLVSAALGAVFATGSGTSGFEEGVQVGLTVGSVFAVLFTAALSFVVLRAKGLLGHVGYLLVGLVGVAGAVVAGMLLGLVFAAFLTTRPVSTSIDAVARPIDGATAH
jgi:hypothetical protein